MLTVFQHVIKKCLNILSYLIQKKPVFRRPANGKVECEKTQKFVGAFKVDLIMPKVKSEPFIQYYYKCEYIFI